MWRRKILPLIFIVLFWLLAFLAAGSADFNNDYKIDINDLALFTSYWLYDYNDNLTCSTWDLYESGQIDLYDLEVITENWLSDYTFEDFAGFARYWNRVVDYGFLDDRFDMSGDGRVDWGDFSYLSASWMATLNPCDDTNDTGVWEYQNFTNIGPCDETGCWFSLNRSDYIYDDCGGRLYVECEETPELGDYCGYNFWFGWYRRVGLCIYRCGINSFQVMKSQNGKRILRTRHRTQDQLYYLCDQGTSGKYDWQVVVYDDVNGVKTGHCRESYLDPSVNNLWKPNEGDPSSCENHWW
ncbi:MAG: hypothetical protein WC374_04045 [Phycisphaerae bacterium]|jgi:hypothetical protein